MKPLFVLTDPNGDIVAWASTISAIRSRLLRCRPGIVYTVTSSLWGEAKLQGKKTPLRDLLRMIYRFPIYLPYAAVQDAGETTIVSFATDKFVDVLALLARWVESQGCEIVRLEPSLLEIKKRAA